MIGYFLLGAYLPKLRARTSIVYVTLLSSFILTIAATYLVVGTLGEKSSQFFYDASSITVILASISLFLALTAVSPQKIENRFPKIKSLIALISANTLSIYLFHVMVLEALQKGYFGIKISVTTMNPVLEIPLITALTLTICLAVLIPIKKIPYFHRLVG
jgi:surface polysaccharide O-acyltransferase-like enzyme